MLGRLLKVSKDRSWWERFVPQWLVRWVCARDGHTTNEFSAVGIDPAKPDHSVAMTVRTCRCGDEQTVNYSGGKFPRKRTASVPMEWEEL